MARLKHWISAFRLRTLFLAVATVVLGSGLAWHEGTFSITTFILAFLLAVSIQILANLANDLGDYQKGTDITGRRQGPTRALQSGTISPKEMKGAIALLTGICVMVGLTLVLQDEASGNGLSAVILIGLGAACILAALFYTIGKKAYGYKGWGDIFAFLFFGPVPVIGTYFLHTHSFDFQPVLPSVSLGLISTMILNINNMRDIENDKASGKITIAVKLGLPGAKIYHMLMTFVSFSCLAGYNILFESGPWYRYVYLLVFLMPFNILNEIRHKSGQELDPYLRATSLSGFLLALAFAICINL
ncbi:MAG: 1,4-dihydroxy-2-naphthoate octaprenyltransferase [Proteiniphilum sp.]